MLNGKNNGLGIAETEKLLTERQAKGWPGSVGIHPNESKKDRRIRKKRKDRQQSYKKRLES